MLPAMEKNISASPSGTIISAIASIWRGDLLMVYPFDSAELTDLGVKNTLSSIFKLIVAFKLLH